MGTIHFIQQGKGGVGKSLIASLAYQLIENNGKEVVAYDTDPENATLAGYKEFNVKRLDIMEGDNINPRTFDALMEELVLLPEGTHAIIDNGASSFYALGGYLRENQVLELLQEENHTVYLHSVITGGQAITDTLGGLKRLCDGFPNVQKIVWLNPYFGEIAMDGKEFEEFKIYDEYSSQFSAVIKLPIKSSATTGKDLEDLFAKRMSFKAGINSSMGIMVKRRLSVYWDELVALIGNAEFLL